MIVIIDVYIHSKHENVRHNANKITRNNQKFVFKTDTKI